MPRHLTRRETQLLAAMLHVGTASKELAVQFGLSPGTIKAYKSRLSQKLGLSCSDLLRAGLLHERKLFMRDQALLLDAWLKKWDGQIPVEADKELRGRLADLVTEYVAGGQCKT